MSRGGFKLRIKGSLVGALRKHAGGMFLATDRSGYAARRELSGAVCEADWGIA